MKKVRTVFILLFLSFLIFSPTSAQILNTDKKTDYKDNLSNFSQGLKDNAGYNTENDLSTVIGNITKMILSLLGSVFLIYLFVAGNQWMQAAGNEEKIKKSKARIQSLIIGLLVIVIAYALSSGFGAILAKTLTTFK